jgi:hypothetical protein
METWGKKPLKRKHLGGGGGGEGEKKLVENCRCVNICISIILAVEGLLFHST